MTVQKKEEFWREKCAEPYFVKRIVLYDPTSDSVNTIASRNL